MPQRAKATRVDRTKPKYRSKWEEQYADHVLALLLKAGEIVWYSFEAVQLRIAEGATYKPDFMVVTKDGTVEIHEVKGHWREAAKVRWKLVKEKYPFVFKLVKKRGSTFQVEEE